MRRLTSLCVSVLTVACVTTMMPTGAHAAPVPVPASGADSADGSDVPGTPAGEAGGDTQSQAFAFRASRPTAATRLTATPVTGGTSTVSWAPPTRGAGSVVGYVTTRRAVVNGALQLRSQVVGARSTSVRYADLAPAVRYTVTVRPLSAAGLGPNAAVALASPAIPPGAPTDVRTEPAKTAGSVTVSWAAPAQTGGKAVTGYRVVATPVGGAARAPVAVPGKARSALLTGLTAGTRYRIDVTAVNPAGVGAAATVEYAAPAAAGPAVVALDTAAQRVVRIGPDGSVVPLGTSALTAANSIAVDAAGNTFAADRGGDTVLRFAAGTGAQTTLGTGWTDPQQIQTDAQGRVYVLDGTRVVRIDVDGTSTVLGTVDHAGFLLVDGAGNASVLWASYFREWSITTFPAAGGAPVVRALEPGYGLRSARIAKDGTLYLEREASGVTGASFVVRVAPGSMEETQLSDRQAIYAYTTDPSGALVLLQSRLECLPPPYATDCVSDRTVDEYRTFPAGSDVGAPTSVSDLALPVRGLAAGPDGLYVARSTEGVSELVRYGAGGGAPTVIAAGSYADPELLAAS